MELRDWVNEATVRLAHVESPRLEAQLLAGHLFLQERSWVLTHPEAEVPEVAAEALLQRRLAGEPLAYILGWREFYGRRFRVTQAVLIPRPETELLVEWAMKNAPKNGRLLEIGVGSGCVIASIAHERPDLLTIGTELSEAALEVALDNARELPNVQLVHTDLAHGLSGSFDLVVSNPPYIEEEAPLPADVQREPGLALFAGPDGLAIYRRLASELPPLMVPNGQAALEHGEGQGPAIRAIFAAQGWKSVDVLYDLAGIERVQILSRSDG